MGETVSRRVFLANTGKLVGFCVLSHFAMVGKAEETFSGICASCASPPRLDNFLLKDWCKAPWFTIVDHEKLFNNLNINGKP